MLTMKKEIELSFTNMPNSEPVEVTFVIDMIHFLKEAGVLKANGDYKVIDRKLGTTLNTTTWQIIFKSFEDTSRTTIEILHFKHTNEFKVFSTIEVSTNNYNETVDITNAFCELLDKITADYDEFKFGTTTSENIFIIKCIEKKGVKSK